MQLLSGEQEAAISFRGATAELSPDAGPWLVTDIGGGSTELVVGPHPYAARSLDLGCVRVTERFLRHDPASVAELDVARRWLADQFAATAEEAPALAQGRCLVGLAGTVSALACFVQGLPAYDRRWVHHYRLRQAAVEQALAELAPVGAAGRAGRPGIEAARAPYIVAGALVLAVLMGHFGFDECVVSESDILDGLVLALVEAPVSMGGGG